MSKSLFLGERVLWAFKYVNRWLQFNIDWFFLPKAYLNRVENGENVGESFV